MALGRRVRRIMGIDQANEYFVAYVQRTNANLARFSGVAVAIVELLLFINSIAHKGTYADPAVARMNRAHAISYLSFGIVSLVLSMLAIRAIRNNRAHSMVIPTITYICIATVYGVFNSVLDARLGEPPLTFIFCMVATTCVFVIPPAGSFNIISIAFIAFAKLADVSGTFAPNTVFHYWVGWIIVTFVSILRYQECRYGARFEEELHDASELDDLTGLRNRRALRTDFEGFMGVDLCVAMCDLDDFKAVNDRYGHAVGDRVLAAMGRAIQCFFDSGLCYRYGGDEFLIISTGSSSPDEFRGRLEDVRTAFAELMAADERVSETPTMSAGFAYGHVTTGEDMRAMVHIADTCLYEVKNAKKGNLRGEAFVPSR